MIPLIHHIELPDAAMPSGMRRLAYLEWGKKEAVRTVFCVHGLSRNARDFDYLATALAEEGYRVICMDVVGRGRSDWLEDPSFYTYDTYVRDAIAMLDVLGLRQVEWVGTSMGGIIGMLLAMYQPQRIRHLVLNDVGPHIPSKALARILKYVSQSPEMDSMETAERVVRIKLATFGIKDETHWKHLITHSLTRREDGKYVLSYDPRIIKKPQSDQAIADVLMWDVWRAIHHPTLVLRGGESDVLLPETAEAMRRSGPEARLITFPGIGHAPTLMEKDQINTILQWLKKPV